mgnify:CR=1 FL=1
MIFFCIKFLGKVDNAHFREYNIFSFSWLLKIGKCCKNSMECLYYTDNYTNGIKMAKIE